MSRVEKIKSERVLCDEIFHVSATEEDVEFDLPHGTNLGEDPTIEGTITVGVLDCDLDSEDDAITATVVFMVQEELLVTPGGEGAEGEPFELEYGFRIMEELTFQKCQLPEELGIEDVRCQVFRLEADGQMQNIELPADNTAVFDNIIRIVVKIKVVEEIQTFVSTRTAPYITTGEVLSS